MSCWRPIGKWDYMYGLHVCLSLHARSSSHDFLSICCSATSSPTAITTTTLLPTGCFEVNATCAAMVCQLGSMTCGRPASAALPSTAMALAWSNAWPTHQTGGPWHAQVRAA